MFFSYSTCGLYQDMVSTPGFVTALTYTLRGGHGSLDWLATVCSTWVFMCQASTKRSTSVPEGDETIGNVYEGNIMATRSALIAGLDSVFMKAYCNEQQRGSLMYFLALIGKKSSKTQ